VDRRRSHPLRLLSHRFKITLAARSPGSWGWVRGLMPSAR
jgi:hypothetical protein